jgi:hypothetical protein
MIVGIYFFLTHLRNISSAVGRLASAPGKHRKKSLFNQFKFDVMIFFFLPLILFHFFKYIFYTSIY